MAIAKGHSVPADTMRPSLLTTLPPELRNHIYERLFVSDKPIEVTSVHSYTSCHSDSSDDPDDAIDQLNAISMHYFPRWLEESRILRQNKRRRYMLFRRIAILGTCRQIYHEASGIMYGQNHFTIVADRANARSALRWLSTIALQQHCLAKLTVCISVLESQGWVPDRELEILPILRMMWRCAGPDTEVLVSELPDPNPGLRRAGPNVKALNASLRSIGYHDVLNLRRYAFSEKLIESISITQDGKKGKITYGSVYGVVTPVRNTFTTSEGGARVRMDPIPKRNVLECAHSTHFKPDRIYEMILQYATSSLESVRVDLTTNGYPTRQMGLLWVNRELRSDALHIFLRTSYFIFTFTSSKSRLSDLNVKAITQWPFSLKSDLGPRQRRPGSKYYKRDLLKTTSSKRFEFFFDFRVQNNTIGLDAIRINIVDFLCATAQAPGSTMVRCQIATADASQSEQASLTLKNLRLNVFIILSHVLEAKPWRTHQQCPAVYVNGHGYAVETVNPGRKRYQRLLETAELIAQQKKGLEEAEKYVRKFGHLIPSQSYLDYFSPKTGKLTLVELWGNLRDVPVLLSASEPL
jgi:hypothetical protein